jgi:hypothetical protein
VVLGAAVVLAVAAPTYGIWHVVHPWQTPAVALVATRFLARRTEA